MSDPRLTHAPLQAMVKVTMSSPNNPINYHGKLLGDLQFHDLDYTSEYKYFGTSTVDAPGKFMSCLSEDDMVENGERLPFCLASVVPVPRTIHLK